MDDSVRTAVHISKNGTRWERHNRGYKCGFIPGTEHVITIPRHDGRQPRSRVTGTALLSRPDKMPGPSWSLPARHACPYAVFGPGTVCGTCYADNKGSYRTAVVRDPQEMRFVWVRECMKTPAGQDSFVDLLSRTLIGTGQDWCRIHDSGDFFSPAYVRCWYRICQAVPHMRFWAPTRSWQASWVSELVRLNSLSNVTVRPSALYIGDPPPVVAGLAAGTTVLPWSQQAPPGGTSVCEAITRGHHCGDCRICWLQPDTPVSYPHFAPHNRHPVQANDLVLQRSHP